MLARDNPVYLIPGRRLGFLLRIGLSNPAAGPVGFFVAVPVCDLLEVLGLLSHPSQHAGAGLSGC